MTRTLAIALGGALLLVGCKGKSDPGGDGGTDDGTASSGGIDPTADDGADGNPDTGDATAGGDADAGTDAGTSQDTGGDADAGSGDASTGTADTGSNTGGNGPGVDCGGTTYACGDGIDNDGDGYIDLFDPECTGPCDDDESSFQTGIPGDNMDCKQDCFFDGNSGQGDDGCIWDLKCDPENPGEFINCEYTGGNNCDNMPPNQSPGCIEFCMPFVPPGCDCFGCCEVQTDEGSVHIFLNSDPDCAFDNLDACTSCTPSEDCVNDCVPEDCEICFGETEPPPGCDGNMCDFGDPCMDNSECPTDWYCLQGCCIPPPPG